MLIYDSTSKDDVKKNIESIRQSWGYVDTAKAGRTGFVAKKPRIPALGLFCFQIRRLGLVMNRYSFPSIKKD